MSQQNDNSNNHNWTTTHETKFQIRLMSTRKHLRTITNCKRCSSTAHIVKGKHTCLLQTHSPHFTSTSQIVKRQTKPRTTFTFIDNSTHKSYLLFNSDLSSIHAGTSKTVKSTKRKCLRGLPRKHVISYAIVALHLGASGKSPWWCISTRQLRKVDTGRQVH